MNNAEHGHVDSKQESNDSASGGTAGDTGARRKEFARRAMAAAVGLPSQVRERIRHNPYGTIGAAGAVGLGVGVVLSSRILRAALTTALIAAAVELARGIVREGVFRVKST